MVKAQGEAFDATIMAYGAGFAVGPTGFPRPSPVF